MNQEIGKLKTLGEISKIYLNALGIDIDKKFYRLCEEDKVDLEIIKSEINKYFDNLSLKTKELIAFDGKKYKLNIDIVKILKKQFYTFYDGYTLLIQDLSIYVSQEKLDKELEEKYFRLFIDSSIEKVLFILQRFTYITDIENNNYYSQIKKHILTSLNKNSFIFLINKNERERQDYTSYKDYRAILEIGEYFHSDQTLNELITSIYNYQGAKGLLEKYKIELSFYFARFYQEFIKKSCPLLSETILKNEKLLVFNPDNCENLIKNLFIELQTPNDNLKNEILILDNLKKKVDLNTKKTLEDRDNFIKTYENLKEKNISLKWFLYHIYGRHLVMNNELNKGLEYYELSLEEGSYRAGKLINKIIKEGLVLSAYLKKKRSFETFYKQAHLYSLVSSPLKDESEWIIDHYGKDFNSLFPSKGFYEPTSEENNYIFTINKDTIPDLNLKKPNLKYKYLGRIRSQLEIFSLLSSFNDIDLEKKFQNNMKMLIEAGADINFVNSTGETPLIGAICAKKYERALILLENPSIKESINQVSNRKKNTALHVLLDDIWNSSGLEKEILVKLIEAGANVNQKAFVDNISPLYILLSKFSKININQNIPRNEINNYRRVMSSSSYQNFYFDRDLENNLNFFNNVIPKKFKQKCIKFINDFNKKNRGLFLEMIEILLEHGANINDPWEKKGITPLLYLAEIGDIEILKMFLKYNPDFSKGCNRYNNDILAISLGYNNFEFFKYLIDHYSFENYKICDQFIKLICLTYNNFDEVDKNIDYTNVSKYLEEFIKKSNLSEEEKRNLYQLIYISINNLRE